jgi:hypothetical protein
VEHGWFQPWNDWNAASYMPSEKPVGVSLLAMASAHPASVSLEYRYREQAELVK